MLEPSVVPDDKAHTMCIRLGLSQDHADECSKEKAGTTQVHEKKEQYEQVTNARTTINNCECFADEEKETIFSYSTVRLRCEGN